MIAGTPTLQERELLKRAIVSDTISAALRKRGVDESVARLLGEEEAEELLQQTLDEEGETDKKLTDLAEEIVNEQALVGDEAEETVTAKAGRR